MLTDYANGQDFMTKADGGTIANRVNATGTFTVEQGVTATSRKAMVLDGTSNCIQLINLSADARIAKTCFATPSNCNRGVSASLWLKFKTPNNFVEEVFYGTGEIIDEYS